MSKYSIELSDSAKRELREILDYYFSDLENPVLAVKVLRKINEAIDSLATFPEGYQVYEGKTDEKLRSVRAMRYRIFYMVDNKRRVVSIAHIVYAGRDFEQILGGER